MPQHNSYFPMEFKIDTKSTYTNIKPPEAPIDAIMTENIRQKWYELVDDGCQNLILDLENSTSADENGIAGLLKLHEDCYSNGRSFVIVSLAGLAARQVKESEKAAALNIAPTQAEAVDIINMEILERELFDEE